MPNEGYIPQPNYSPYALGDSEDFHPEVKAASVRQDLPGFLKSFLLTHYFAGTGFNQPREVFDTAQEYVRRAKANDPEYKGQTLPEDFAHEVLRDAGFFVTPEGNFLPVSDMNLEPRAGFIKKQISEFLG